MDEQDFTLGVDLACSAAHVRDARRRRRPAGGSEPAVPHGHSRVAAVWAKVPAGARLQLVIEPTRNAWVPLTAWFRARGATVILLPRRYVAKTDDE